MGKTAPRIAASIWEQYKDEITALYSSPGGTLKKTMQVMEETHGFTATKNQYTKKLNEWELKKYANPTVWAFVDQRRRKRKLEEGKDTEFSIYGRKKSRSEVDKEIARNVTHTSRLQLLEDIATPEGVQVFTPEPDVSSAAVILREVYTNNLPCVQLQRDIQALLSRLMKNSISQPLPTLNMLDQPSVLYSPAKMLQIALGDEVQSIDLSLTSFLPSSDTNHNPMTSLCPDVSDMPSRYVALKAFIQGFLVLTNKNMLKGHLIFKGVDWLLKNIDLSLFSHLFSLKTTTVKMFMRKIFPAVVLSGNIKVAKYIIDLDIDMTRHPKHKYYYATSLEDCMSIAVANEDNRMVKLLCEAGFPTQIKEYFYYPGRPYTNRLPWRTGKLEALQTLFSFVADPECLCEGEERGFALVDAADSGSVEAVEMLCGARHGVNLYVPRRGTPLQAAVCAGHLEIAKFLLEHGADVNAPYGTQYHIHSLFQKLPWFFGERERESLALNTSLEIACKKNNTSLVEMLLDYGALADFSPLSQFDIENPESVIYCYGSPVGYSPNYEDILFHTALQYSVKNRNVSHVRRLLWQRANPDSRTISGWGDTPLQMSIRLDYPEITQMLIDNRANVNAPPGRVNGRTAIQAAAESGNIQVAQMLLSRNADLNAPAGYIRGLTALQAAIRNGHSLMAGLLWMSGADLHAPPGSIKGLAAIQAAAEIGDLGMIKSLVRANVDVNTAAAQDGKTAIAAILSHRNLSMLEFLVEHGADVNGLEDDRMPPIVVSAMTGWVDGTRYLLKRGASANSPYYGDKSGHYISPLGWSIINNDFEMMELLLENGADLHFPFSDDICSWDVYYQDALCLALEEQRSRELILSLLHRYTWSGSISFHQDVLATAVTFTSKDNVIVEKILIALSELPKPLFEAQIRNAWSKLHRYDFWEFVVEDSDQNDAIEKIKLLLNAGADINSELDFGSGTLLQLAVLRGRIDIAEYLLEKGAEVNIPAAESLGTPLQEAIRTQKLEFAYRLLKHGADVNAAPAEDEGGCTALQAAAFGGHKDLVVDLLERGAEVNAPPAERRGVTALQAAAIKGHLDIAVKLLQHGAHVAAAAAPSEGRTAIDSAAEHGEEDMLQLLLNHYDGCEDLTVVCNRAADYAEREGHFEIAQSLRGYANSTNL